MTEKIQAWLYECMSSKIVVRPDQISWFEMYGEEENCILYVHLIGEIPSDSGPSMYVTGKAAVQFLRWISNYWDIKTIYEVEKPQDKCAECGQPVEDGDYHLPTCSKGPESAG